MTHREIKHMPRKTATKSKTRPDAERTFIMIKPDAVQRGLMGRVLQRFEDRAMKVVAMKLIGVTEALAMTHYAEHEGKTFYPRLMAYIQSGPVVVAVIEAPNAVSQVRKMVGATNPADAEVGTIRRTWAQDIAFNVIHASDSLESARREIGIYFKPSEIVSYDLDIHRWLFPAQ
jgi:nucleoside-diphosphate kinase